MRRWACSASKFRARRNLVRKMSDVRMSGSGRWREALVSGVERLVSRSCRSLVRDEGFVSSVSSRSFAAFCVASVERVCSLSWLGKTAMGSMLEWGRRG